MSERQFISGIFNFCDRWCERCALTARCRVYEKEEIRQKTKPDQEVFEAVAENFTETIEMLQKMADEMGINLAMNEEELEQQKLERDSKEKKLENHPLKLVVDSYFDDASAWTKSERVKEYFLELTRHVELGTLAIAEGEQRVRVVEESLEVIQWYLFFIAGKINRLLNDLGEDFWSEYPDEERGDLGTAKITIIAIEKSLSAWAALYKLLPEDDQVLHLLSTLEKIRRLVMTNFPNYEKFKRPGFDD